MYGNPSGKRINSERRRKKSTCPGVHTQLAGQCRQPCNPNCRSKRANAVVRRKHTHPYRIVRHNLTSGMVHQQPTTKMPTLSIHRQAGTSRQLFAKSRLELLERKSTAWHPSARQHTPRWSPFNAPLPACRPACVRAAARARTVCALAPRTGRCRNATTAERVVNAPGNTSCWPTLVWVARLLAMHQLYGSRQLVALRYLRLAAMTWAKPQPWHEQHTLRAHTQRTPPHRSTHNKPCGRQLTPP